MDRKRKSHTASSSTPTKKRTTTPRPAKRYRRVTESGGTRVSNVRTNGAKRLQDVKVIKVSNRRAGPGAFTIVATPRARIGDSGVIDGVRYVVRSEQELRSLIGQRKWNEVERTCTSRITNMRQMFIRAGRFRSLPPSNVLNSWDTSRVTDMSYMFYDALVVNQRIGAWDTKRVKTMQGMFMDARAFNQPIGAWNTSSVTDMRGMFSGARAFNQSIGAWDTSRVTDMSGMFMDARAFNHSLNGWDTSRVRDMSYMFREAHAFNHPIGAWDTTRVKTMHDMFADARVFNQPIAEWNVSRVEDMSDMFMRAYSFRQDLSAWATRLSSNVEIDWSTRYRIADPRIAVAAFRARRYRLHPEANAIDPVLLNRVNLDDAVVLAGDLHGDSKLRHIFSRATTDGIFRVGRTPKHPVTRTPIHPEQVVPLRAVLHANDAAIYNHVGTPAGTVQARTVKQVRESNARNVRNARNARNMNR